MPVSKALRKSANDFCKKYACSFDFAAFESTVEGYIFLNPNNGWREVYKRTFEEMHKQALEKTFSNAHSSLDGEAMLDDFEYALIRPFVNEKGADIKHKPYVGMDRIARLEYLLDIMKKAPSTPVLLYADKYKRGELPIRGMRLKAKSLLTSDSSGREDLLEIAGYIQALERVNRGRSLIWKAFHPILNSAEKKNSALMKMAFVGGEDAYAEFAAEANETFGAHIRANAILEQNMAHALEELNMKQKMKDAMRESHRRSLPVREG